MDQMAILLAWIHGCTISRRLLQWGYMLPRMGLWSRMLGAGALIDAIAGHGAALTASA